MIHFQEWRGAALLRYRNRAKITLLMWTEAAPSRGMVPRRRKSYSAWCEQNLTLRISIIYKTPCYITYQ